MIDGEVPKDVWDDLAGPYATRDGYVRIQTNFPQYVAYYCFSSISNNKHSHRQGILSLLQSVGTRSAVSEALLKENAVDFETRATTAGMCVSAIRSFGQWDRHPHAQTLVGRLPIELIKIGDASPRKFEPSSKPLGGVKVLELTRIMAGPVAGRTLAHFGADVLWITSPNLPSLPVIDIDTSRGKRAAQLDLNEARDVDKLRELLEGADVFLQSYRPGSLESRGFGPAELASLKGGRGIIVANLRGYGWEGPWANKRAVRYSYTYRCTLCSDLISSTPWCKLPLASTSQRGKHGLPQKGSLYQIHLFVLFLFRHWTMELDNCLHLE